MDKFIPNKNYVASHQNTAIQSISINFVSQILALRLWYPSIKFGHEINLKDLMCLVLLD